MTQSGFILPDSLNPQALALALARVRAVLPVTPLIRAHSLSDICQHEIFLKWDNKFRTGSFKERGAVNVLSGLSESDRARGVCAASAGNHALAMSYHAGRMKIACTIVMPVQAPLVKVQATRATGARVILKGKNFDEAYDHALNLANLEGAQFISPFDDERIVAGQSTCGQELADQIADADYVVVPVGGGGLISGIAIALRQRGVKAKIIGVQSEWVIHGRAGHHSSTLIPPVTIADGIAVKRIGKVTGPLVSAYVDGLVTVTEEEVADGIARLLEHERAVVEGAGAAALAAVMRTGCVPGQGKKVAVLVCGSNIDMSVLSRLIQRDMGQNQRLLKVSVSVPDRPGSLATVTKLFADQNANILEVLHNRSFSKVPGNVKIDFLLEVREAAHTQEILAELTKVGLPFEL